MSPKKEQKTYLFFLKIISSPNHDELILIITDNTKELSLRELDVQFANESNLLLNQIMDTNAYISKLIDAIADNLLLILPE